LGFTPEVQALARQGMMMTIKSVGTGNNMLGKVLKNIMADKDKYLGNHAIVTAQVACSLATVLKWSSDTTFQKLTFAAFFHDIAITNNKLAQVENDKELSERVSEFTEDEVKRYRVHPAIATQVTSKFKEVPTDVDVIISQHHERPDGSGFPRKLVGDQIAPLAALFIISHDLVDRIFKHGNTNLAEFLTEYKAKYSVGRFGKILQVVDASAMGLDTSAPPAGATNPGPASTTSAPAAAAKPAATATPPTSAAKPAASSAAPAKPTAPSGQTPAAKAPAAAPASAANPAAPAAKPAAAAAQKPKAA
jgi:hypothetical protein